MKKALLLIFTALFVGMPIFMWSRILTVGLPWPVYLYDVGRLFALTVFVLLVLQYVLSSRIKWIEKGIGLDRLFGIHRVCGGPHYRGVFCLQPPADDGRRREGPFRPGGPEKAYSYGALYPALIKPSSV